jgi:hypothetical protein
VKLNWMSIYKAFLITMGSITICTMFVWGLVALNVHIPTVEERYQEEARKIKACTDAGGEWYNSPGWGENCNFDTRNKD